VSLNLLEPSGPVQGCNGTALPFYTLHKDDNKDDDDDDDNNNNNNNNKHQPATPPYTTVSLLLSYLLKFCPQIMNKTKVFNYKPADTKGGAWPPTGAQHGLNKHVKQTRPCNIIFRKRHTSNFVLKKKRTHKFVASCFSRT
jgi:hypothetical protein